MNIRSEELHDKGAINAVLENSFSTHVEANLVDLLRKSGRLTVSLVAEVEGAIVGYVGFSPVTVHGLSNGVGLAPLAVLPEFRKRGIADSLIRRGVEICKQQNCGFVVVLGEPDYYKRFGFVSASNWGLRDEYGGGDAFQAMELRTGTIPEDGGIVKYSPEFATFDDGGTT